MILGLNIITIFLILSVFGVFSLFFGYSLVRFFALMLGFMVGFIASYILLPNIALLTQMWILILSVLIGIIISLIMFKLHLIVPFILGVISIYVLGVSFLTVLPIDGYSYYYIFIGVIAILGGLAGIVLKDCLLILWSSLFGAVVLSLTAGLFYFSDLSSLDITSYVSANNALVIALQSEPRFLFGLFLLLFVLGLIVQIYITSKSQVFLKKFYFGKHRNSNSNDKRAYIRNPKY